MYNCQEWLNNWLPPHQVLVQWGLKVKMLSRVFMQSNAPLYSILYQFIETFNPTICKHCSNLSSVTIVNWLCSHSKPSTSLNLLPGLLSFTNKTFRLYDMSVYSLIEFTSKIWLPYNISRFSSSYSWIFAYSLFGSFLSSHKYRFFLGHRLVYLLLLFISLEITRICYF